MDTKQLGLFGEIANGNGRKRLRSPNRNEQSTNGKQIHELVSEIVTLKNQIADLESTIAELRNLLISQKTIKDSYDTKEIAQILDRKPYTVREWCRLKRINAYKAQFGRGAEEEWRVTHDELVRIQNEGLLPIPNRY
ncbi:MAG: helix-turn-helix domain-containing protein [Planctomycetota bacterium]